MLRNKLYPAVPETPRYLTSYDEQIFRIHCPLLSAIFTPSGLDLDGRRNTSYVLKLKLKLVQAHHEQHNRRIMMSSPVDGSEVKLSFELESRVHHHDVVLLERCGDE